MKNLANHIISLLRLYDSVELPGIGIFSLSYNPAFLDKELKIFNPPYYSVNFQRSENVESELLLDSYMKKDRISSEKASILLDNDLSRLFHSLEKHGVAALPGLGSLTYEEDIISFSPQESFILSLPHVSLGPVGQVDSETSCSQQEENIVEEFMESARIPDNYHYHKPSCYYIPINKNFARFAASILLVVAVGVAAFIPMGTIKSNSSTASMLPMEINRTAVQRSENKTQKTEKQLPVLQIVAPEASVPSESEIIPDVKATPIDTISSNMDITMDEDRYFAVVAAFKSGKEAEKFLDQNKDVRNMRVVMKSKVRLITVDSSKNKEELSNRMASIRETYPDAWIYTRPE